MIHLDKQFVKRVHLIGITVGKQLLNIIEEEDASLGILDILIPVIDKALIVDGVNYCQFRFIDDAMEIEIVTENLSQQGLTRSCLADDYRVDTQTHVRHIFARTKE